MKIRRDNIEIKSKLPEYLWDEKILKEVRNAASDLRRSDLVLFWLEWAASQSDNLFEQWLKDMPQFSTQELIDIIDEWGQPTGEKFLRRFK